jgi:hypothetical protein
LGRAALFRIESERLKLPAPFSRRIAEPLNADVFWLRCVWMTIVVIKGRIDSWLLSGGHAAG